MAKEADSLPNIDVSFLTNGSNTKVKTKPASEVQYSRKHSDNLNINGPVVKKKAAVYTSTKVAAPNNFEEILMVLGSKRTDQFFKLKSLADENGMIPHSTKEIGAFLGLKKQATSNLCDCLLEAGLITIYREYDSKKMIPRLFRLASEDQKASKTAKIES